MARSWDWSCLTGTVVLPDNPNYNIDRTNYCNTRYTRSPSALVFCQSVVDVQNAVRRVLQNGAPFRVRSGRHSYEELSLTDGGLIIDVSGLTATSIDPPTATARVGVGLTQQAMWNLLGANDVWAFPLGTMGGVGIAGVLLGGGHRDVDPRVRPGPPSRPQHPDGYRRRRGRGSQRDHQP